MLPQLGVVIAPGPELQALIQPSACQLCVPVLGVRYSNSSFSNTSHLKPKPQTGESAADHIHGRLSLGDRPPDWHQNKPTCLGGSSLPGQPIRDPCNYLGSRPKRGGGSLQINFRFFLRQYQKQNRRTPFKPSRFPAGPGVSRLCGENPHPSLGWWPFPSTQGTH